MACVELLFTYYLLHLLTWGLTWSRRWWDWCRRRRWVVGSGPRRPSPSGLLACDRWHGAWLWSMSVAARCSAIWPRTSCRFSRFDSGSMLPWLHIQTTRSDMPTVGISAQFICRNRNQFQWNCLLCMWRWNRFCNSGKTCYDIAFASETRRFKK